MQQEEQLKSRLLCGEEGMSGTAAIDNCFYWYGMTMTPMQHVWWPCSKAADAVHRAACTTRLVTMHCRSPQLLQRQSPARSCPSWAVMTCRQSRMHPHQSPANNQRGKRQHCICMKRLKRLEMPFCMLSVAADATAITCPCCLSCTVVISFKLFAIGRCCCCCCYCCSSAVLLY